MVLGGEYSELQTRTVADEVRHDGPTAFGRGGFTGIEWHLKLSRSVSLLCGAEIATGIREQGIDALEGFRRWTYTDGRLGLGIEVGGR
jgi:hypothetical protein